MSMNPPRKLTTVEKVERKFGRHLELAIYILGIITGAILARI